MEYNSFKELKEFDDKIQKHNHQLLFDDKIDIPQFVAKQKKRKAIYEHHQAALRAILLNSNLN